MTEQESQPGEGGPEAGPELGDEVWQETGDQSEAEVESQMRASGVDEPDQTGSGARTGVPAVDEVVAEVDRLDDRPLEEHLATFERAHERLRAALDADPGDAGDPAGSGDPGDSA